MFLKIYWRRPLAQAVRRSPPTAGVSSSHLGYSIWISWWTKLGLDRFLSGFLPVPPTEISFQYFSIFNSFHFMSTFDGATHVVGR